MFWYLTWIPLKYFCFNNMYEQTCILSTAIIPYHITSLVHNKSYLQFYSFEYILNSLCDYHYVLKLIARYIL